MNPCKDALQDEGFTEAHLMTFSSQGVLERPLDLKSVYKRNSVYCQLIP